MYMTLWSRVPVFLACPPTGTFKASDLDIGNNGCRRHIKLYNSVYHYTTMRGLQQVEASVLSLHLAPSLLSHLDQAPSIPLASGTTKSEQQGTVQKVFSNWKRDFR